MPQLLERGGHWRADREPTDDRQILVRFGRDVDVAQALRVALVASPLHRSVPAYERGGAICVSAFLVRDEADARQLLTDTLWDHYGLCDVGRLRRSGYEVLGTDIEEDGSLIPHTERHVDVVVAFYPPNLLPYDQLPKDGRRRLREQLIEPYSAALRLFDPRLGSSEGVSGQ